LQAAGGAHGHADLAGGDRKAGEAAVACGDGLAHRFVAGVAHVAVQPGPLVEHQAAKGLLHGAGRFEVRVAQAEVIDLVGAVERFEPVAFLKHLANHGAATHLVGDFARDHVNLRAGQGCRRVFWPQR